MKTFRLINNDIAKMLYKTMAFCLCLLCLVNITIPLGYALAAQQTEQTSDSSTQEALPTLKPGQISIIDDTGFELILEKPATRVLALYGAFSELMLALGQRELLVGRTAADASIEELKDLPVVGTHMRPNIELILSLNPQVVIQFMGREEAESLGIGLRRHGLPVLLFNMETFDDMFRVIAKLGQLIGHEELSQALIANYEDRLGDLRRILMDKKRVRVFYEVRYPNLLAAGPNSIVTDIIHIAGGSNVINLSGRVIRINEEELVHKRPDAYIIQQGPMNMQPKPLAERPNYATLPAVKNGRVLVVDQLSFARPGPRAVDAAEKLARWLHPTVNFDIELD